MLQSHDSRRSPGLRSPPPALAHQRWRQQVLGPPERRLPSPCVCTWVPPAPARQPASPWGARQCGRARCPTRASSRSCGGRPSSSRPDRLTPCRYRAMDKENKLAKLLIQEEPRRSGRPTYQQFKGLQADNTAITSIREVPRVCSFPEPCSLAHSVSESTDTKK